MNLSENRFLKTWQRFQEMLKNDCHCSLSEVCREQHTSLSCMYNWLSRHGYSVQQAKKDAVRDYYGGVSPSPVSSSSPTFAPIVPVMSSEEKFSLSGVTVSFNSGTTITIKRATPDGIIKLLHDYERKEGESCIL